MLISGYAIKREHVCMRRLLLNVRLHFAAIFSLQLNDLDCLENPVSLENKLTFKLQEWLPIVPQSITSPPAAPLTRCVSSPSSVSSATLALYIGHCHQPKCTLAASASHAAPVDLRWVCAARSIKVRTKMGQTNRQTDKRTDARPLFYA